MIIIIVKKVIPFYPEILYLLFLNKHPTRAGMRCVYPTLLSTTQSAKHARSAAADDLSNATSLRTKYHAFTLAN
jgi:hypothetical protein